MNVTILSPADLAVAALLVASAALSIALSIGINVPCSSPRRA